MSTPLYSKLPRGPFVDGSGNLTPEAQRFFASLAQGAAGVLTREGAIQPTAPVVGRTEGIGTTVSKHDSTGRLTDADQIAADGASFVRVNPDQRTGGGRGFQALDPNNRLQNSFRANAVNLSNVPGSTTTLSNDGISTVINIASATDNFGAGTVSDSAGSVDPGAFGTFYVFHDDPTFAGGAVVYQFSITPVSTAAADGRILDGVITTAGGAAKTGGGNNGGTTTGGAGGRGYVSR